MQVTDLTKNSQIIGNKLQQWRIKAADSKAGSLKSAKSLKLNSICHYWGRGKAMPLEKKVKCICKRDFLKTAGTWALAAGIGANIILPDGVNASKKKLKILQWMHTDPDFDFIYEE